MEIKFYGLEGLAEQGFLGAAFEIGKRWREDCGRVPSERVIVVEYPDCFGVVNCAARTFSGLLIEAFAKSGKAPAACARACCRAAQGLDFEGDAYAIATPEQEAAALAEIDVPDARPGAAAAA